MWISNFPRVIIQLTTLLLIICLVILNVSGMAILPKIRLNNSTTSSIHRDKDYFGSTTAPEVKEILYYQNGSDSKSKSDLTTSGSNGSKIKLLSTPNDFQTKSTSNHLDIPLNRTGDFILSGTGIDLMHAYWSNTEKSHKNENKKSWARSQFGSGTSTDIDTVLIKPKRRRRETRLQLSGPLDDMCQLLPPDDGNGDEKPLQCFQCSSNSKDPDPQCDNRLFKYLRHSEKFILRKRCTQETGDYCTKTVKRRFGERITERGCFGAPIIGPDGKEYEGDEGCYTYPKAGYLTTTCFCNSNNCNSAPSKKLSWFALLASIFIYICLSSQSP